MSSERAVELVEQRLIDCNISLDSDIAATITDGASVMMKFGRITNPIHVTCLAHAVHLSICDVLYKKGNFFTRDYFIAIQNIACLRTYR